jgi:hypothetical protein
MTNKIPHFKFHIKSSSSNYSGRIELKGEVIHKIADLGEFYKVCGYNLEMAKNGILPDEYIWETFFRHSDRNCTGCYQLHMIEYLLLYSDTLTKKFRHQCDEWIEVHAGTRASCDVKKCANKKKTS